jgi:hypothetical protein
VTAAVEVGRVTLIDVHSSAIATIVDEPIVARPANRPHAAFELGLAPG